MSDYRTTMSPQIAALISDEMAKTTLERVKAYKQQGFSLPEMLASEWQRLTTPAKHVLNPHRVEQSFNGLLREIKQFILHCAGIQGEPKPLAEYSFAERHKIGAAIYTMRKVQQQLPAQIRLKEFHQLATG